MSLAELLQQGAADRVFGEARAVVLYRGRKHFSGGTVDASARFDLASITKVMATTALCCKLGVDPARRIGEVLGTTAIADRTVADLAYHRSGLPAFTPFFATCKTRGDIVRAALATAPVARCGARAVYSDIGFIILGELLSALHGNTPLDALFAEHIAQPLHLTSASYRRISAPPAWPTVSTGGTRPREPAPGQEGMWQVELSPSREGDVDDDNAYVMDGVAGHAGLFATADDVATYGQAVLDGKIASPLGWAADASVPNSTRAFGFDTPSPTDASCGPRIGPQAIGHLGFTGTSLWIDFHKQLVVALLTNRVIYGRANQQIRQFRPRFHEAVIDSLGEA